MGFNPAIRAKVRKLALDKKSKLTIKDIFMSHEMSNYLNNLAGTMGNKSGETTTVTIGDDGSDGPTAFTDGSRMYINCTNKMLDFFDSMDGKFMGLMGMFFHEKAHDLFCDFNEEKKAMRFISDGNFYGDEPEKMTAEEEGNWTDMMDALREPRTRPIFVNVYDYLCNCIDDYHDEESMIDAFGSFAGEGIYLIRQALHHEFDFFESNIHKINTGELKELPFMFSNMLQLTRFDDILARSHSSVEKNSYWTTLEKIRSHARIACATDDLQRRFSEMNWILLFFWPYIRNAIQQMKDDQQGQQQSNSQDQNGQQSQSNASSGGNNQSQQKTDQGQNGSQPHDNSQSSGNNQGQQNQQSNPDPNGQDSSNGKGQTKTSSLSAQEVQQILDQLKQGMANVQSSPAPKKHHSSDIAITRRANERNGNAPEKNKANASAATQAMSQQGKEALYQVMNSITNEIAQHQAEDELEEEAKGAMTDAVQAINAAGTHNGIPIYTSRVLNVTATDVEVYKEIMRDLSPISKRLQKQLLEALRDLREGYVQKHRNFGRMVVPSDAYRPDQRYFANKKLPQDLPDMAVSVLVDHSGSMRGARITNAMKAALLLHDFCTGLNIPVAVAGHNAVTGGGVNYYIYADFEQISKKDKYRASRMAATLTKMKANNCNRDGAALNISAKMLEHRDEQVKLLIIISDGRPNHDGYGGEEAAKDLQDIVKRCKQKGIEVLACAIGEDKENIAAIYGDGFVDISDLSKLPKTLVSIVKKRIINSAF